MKFEEPIDSETDDEQVSGLLSGLTRVAAPKDFDFRLRARIAHGRPTLSTGRRLPVAVRYAMALGLLLVVAGLIGFVGMYKGIGADVPAVVESPSPGVTNPPVLPPVYEVGVTSTPEEIAGTSPAKTVDTPKRQNGETDIGGPAAKKPAAENRSGGGSYDQTTRQGVRVLPKGISVNSERSPKSSELGPDTGVPVSDIFQMIGVSARFADGGWRVDTVTPNGTAQRVGLRQGDIIEAVNDKPATANLSFKGKFTGRSLLLKRDGKPLRIELQK